MKRLIIVMLVFFAIHTHGATNSFSLTFATTAHAGPLNHLIAFVTSGTGTASATNYVDTIGLYATPGNQYLDESLTWRSLNGTRNFAADVKMGATRTSWTVPIAFKWDLKDKNGNVVPDGTYTIHIENVAKSNDRRYGNFQFVKDSTARTQTVADVAATFTAIQYVYTPLAPAKIPPNSLHLLPPMPKPMR